MDRSDDKIFSAPNAVVMLDGASAFQPVPVPAGVYAHALGERIICRINQAPAADLRDLLAASIVDVTHDLALTRGNSPSSTVTIVRTRDAELEILILGDNLVALPSETLTDDRLTALQLPQQRAYRERLASGSGYDDTHRQYLRDLQTRQAELRNRPGGYWIAETDPIAAEHAALTIRAIESTPWAVLTTDGAYKPMRHLGLDNWDALARSSTEELEAVLHRCHRWEALHDPDGQQFPRAKRHDDKAIAAVVNGTGRPPAEIASSK